MHHTGTVRRFPLLAVAAITSFAAVVASCGAPSAAPAIPTSTTASIPASTTAGAGAVVRAAPGSTLAVSTSASATAPAERQPRPPATTCEQIATNLGRAVPATSQFVIVRTTAWTDDAAVLQVAERSGLGWTCGAEMAARVGRAGLRPLLERRSGDGTTPAGVFGLATMTAWDGQRFSFFGTSPDPGVTAGTYRRTRTGDCFGATPGTAGYGHLRNDTTCAGPDDEYLPDIGAYTNAALIGANMEPDVSGDAPGEVAYAAAIFLHRSTYVTPGASSGATKPTTGCVSLGQTDLTSVLVQMRPDVRFAIGTTEWLLDGAALTTVAEPH